MIKSSEALANLETMDRATLISMVKYYRKQEQKAKENKFGLAVDASSRDAAFRHRLSESQKSNVLDISELGLVKIPLPLDGVPNRCSKALLSKNEFEQVPAEILRFPNLEEIVLAFNCIGALSPNFTFSHLKTLDLSNNKFVTIPVTFGSCPHLTSLDLSNNLICAWPDNLNNLASITHLNLQKNQLSTISPNLAVMSILEDLDLRNNKLTKLNPVLLQVPSLQYLKLGGNPLTSPPVHVVSRGLQAILTYLREPEDDHNNKPLPAVRNDKGHVSRNNTKDLQTENRKIKELLASLAKEYSDLRVMYNKLLKTMKTRVAETIANVDEILNTTPGAPASPRRRPISPRGSRKVRPESIYKPIISGTALEAIIGIPTVPPENQRKSVYRSYSLDDRASVESDPLPVLSGQKSPRKIEKRAERRKRESISANESNGKASDHDLEKERLEKEKAEQEKAKKEKELKEQEEREAQEFKEKQDREALELKEKEERRRREEQAANELKEKEDRERKEKEERDRKDKLERERKEREERQREEREREAREDEEQKEIERKARQEKLQRQAIEDSIRQANEARLKEEQEQRDREAKEIKEKAEKQAAEERERALEEQRRKDREEEERREEEARRERLAEQTRKEQELAHRLAEQERKEKEQAEQLRLEQERLAEEARLERERAEQARRDQEAAELREREAREQAAREQHEREMKEKKEREENEEKARQAAANIEVDCPSCQLKMPPSAAFCRRCGLKMHVVIQAPSIYANPSGAGSTSKFPCISCHASLDPGVPFCKFCGAKQLPASLPTSPVTSPSTKPSGPTRSISTKTNMGIKRPTNAAAAEAMALLSAINRGGVVVDDLDLPPLGNNK